MANLTYTEIYSMTSQQINEVITDNMQNEDFDDIKSINEKLTAIGEVQEVRKKLLAVVKKLQVVVKTLTIKF